jgi:prepilin signal peptidase PulO-like enzyme (type II secretory pathway)
MDALFGVYFLTFFIGIFIGSFLNVLVDRIPRNESFINSRSHCEHCRRTLAWNDLIPVISYVLLGGKCRYCHKHIGYYYPSVELLTGLLFVLTAVYLVPDIRTLASYDAQSLLFSGYFFFVVSSLIVIVFTDVKYGIIPFKIVLAILIATLLYLVYSPFLVNHLITAVGAFGLFLLLFLITKGRGLGFGDVVYALMMGLVLGYPKIIVGLYVAFLTGAIVSLILVWTGKKKMKGGSIPFGPFLVTGTILGMFYGDILVDAALHYLVY